MKTIIEHFANLNEPERSQALKNTKKSLRELKVESIVSALIIGFNGEDTKQGQDYWDDIIAKIHTKKYKLL